MILIEARKCNITMPLLNTTEFFSSIFYLHLNFNFLISCLFVEVSCQLIKGCTKALFHIGADGLETGYFFRIGIDRLR